MNPTFSLLAETPDLLAIDKPAGIVVVPARDEDPMSSLWRRLETERGERLWAVHRIDRDTSGVVVFARTAASHRRLSMAFEHREVHKTYWLLAGGALPHGEGLIEQPLHPARKGKMRPALPGEPGALPSATAYRVLRAWSPPICPVALVEAHPRTGRHHQIRVHMKWIGAPLLVDRLYTKRDRVLAAGLGGQGDAPVCGRLTLHAARLELPDGGGGRLALEAPMPPDLQAILDILDAPRAFP